MNLTIPRRGAAWRGVGYVRNSRGDQVFVPWPKPRGPARSKAQQDAQDTWAYVIEAMKYADPLTLEFAALVSKGVPLLPRDVLMAQMMQRAYWFWLPDGRKVFSMAAMQDVSLLLDTIGQTKGGVFFRDTTFWKSLPNPLALSVLTNDEHGNVAWGVAPTSGTVNVLATLNYTNVATIDLDLRAYVGVYDILEVHILHLLPANDGTDIGGRMGTGSPITWHSGSTDYRWASHRSYSSPGGNDQGGVDSNWNMTNGNGVGNGAAEGFSARLISHNWNIAAQKPRWQWDSDHYSDNDLTVRVSGAARYDTAAQCTGLRFFCGSGNIASAKVKVVGYL